MTEIAQALEETRKEFAPFYAAGQKMAQAYIAGGASAGNAMMPEVDKVADALDKQLKGLIKAAGAVSKGEFHSLIALIEEVQADGGLVRTISSGSSAILMAIIGCAIFFLLYGVVRPLRRMDKAMRILAGGEWQKLQKGLFQRVRALNMFLYDIYHELEIVKAGVIPKTVPADTLVDTSVHDDAAKLAGK